MKIKLALLTSCCVLLTASSALADRIPPDGNIGVRGGGGSQEIFNADFPFTLTPCTPPNSPKECSQFDNPQAVFAGDNDTGNLIRVLTLTLDYTIPKGYAQQTLGCDGGTLFSENNCSAQTLFSDGNPHAVTFTFFQGTGTGIGCFDPNDEGDGGPNARCLENLRGDEDSFSLLGSRLGEPDDGCPVADCGPSPHFVIGVGFGGENKQWPIVPTNGGGQFNSPEPGTMALFVTGLGALVARRRSRKKPSV